MQFTDTDFPADEVSLGVPGSTVTWKRLSEMYPADDLVLFAGTEIWSTMKQGELGDCYYLSTLAALDTRPGALEAIFVTKETNDEGIYAVKFSVNGEDVYVHVDDYVPVTTAYREYTNRDSETAEVPKYAHSAHYGEIWPMIAEKAWAKLVGSYNASEGGDNRWPLSHLTNDPTVSITLDGTYTATNEAGLALWTQLKGWSDAEYLLFTGTNESSWVASHAYTVLELREMEVDGTDRKLVKLRNPWGYVDWTAADSTDSANWEALMSALNARSDFQEEGGKFWMNYEDFLA